jgi:hypothetical protein
VVIGEILLFHVKDELWCGNEMDISKWKPTKNPRAIRTAVRVKSMKMRVKPQ